MTSKKVLAEKEERERFVALYTAVNVFLDEYERVSSERYFGEMLDSAFSYELEAVYTVIAEIRKHE